MSTGRVSWVVGPAKTTDLQESLWSCWELRGGERGAGRSDSPAEPGGNRAEARAAAGGEGPGAAPGRRWSSGSHRASRRVLGLYGTPGHSPSGAPRKSRMFPKRFQREPAASAAGPSAGRRVARQRWSPSARRLGSVWQVGSIAWQPLTSGTAARAIGGPRRRPPSLSAHPRGVPAVLCGLGRPAALHV